MKKRPYIIAMIIFVVVYFLIEFNIGGSQFSDVISTALAIIAAVAFWLELKDNDALNQAKFIMELNNQFISNKELSMVEWDLEKYYAKFSEGSLTEEDNSHLRSTYDLCKRERQYLINYLVHLEGIAAIINEGTLCLDAVNDLMAYRYFIAVNNPVVQELELLPYKNHYQGCYKIYTMWRQKLTDDKIPMSKTCLIKDKSGN